MSKPTPKLLKPERLIEQSSVSLSSKFPCVPAHFANVVLKQQILLSLSKLADRDTHQVALQELRSIAQTLPSKSLPMLLALLFHFSSNFSNKCIVKVDCLYLLCFCCQIHHDLKLPSSAKIITHIVKMLRDSDSRVRDACSDVFGILSRLYLKGEVGKEGTVHLFVWPLLKALLEQKKGVQLGAAMCMRQVIKSAAGEDMPGRTFQQLCPWVCKILNKQNFYAKTAMLGVVASLSEVWAIFFCAATVNNYW